MSKGEAGFGLSCQILVQQKETHQESAMHSPQVAVQLQQALEQISNISTALSDIQCYYQEQVMKESVVIQKQNKYHCVHSLHRIHCYSHFLAQAKPNQSAVEESSVLSELQKLREQLGKSEEERKAVETQLSEANSVVTQLQEEGSHTVQAPQFYINHAGLQQSC